MDYILTNNGAVMMTQVAAGKTLLFTRTESGSGYSASPAVLQSVIDKKQDMFLDEVTYENKQAVVKSVLSNMQLEEEYQLRQVGVYAKLEGDETDTLLLIGQQYNGEKIPSYHDGIMQIEYNIAIKASGTGNITIEGVGTGYVTKGQFLAHLNDHSNPHKVTAKDVNLDKVPNVGTDDQTPVFEEAEERENILSGEKMSVLCGKVKKWLTDLKGAAFCSVANNLVTTLAGSVLDARQGKELQDQITGLYSETNVLMSRSGDIYSLYNYTISNNIADPSLQYYVATEDGLYFWSITLDAKSDTNVNCGIALNDSLLYQLYGYRRMSHIKYIPLKKGDMIRFTKNLDAVQTSQDVRKILSAEYLKVGKYNYPSEPTS